MNRGWVEVMVSGVNTHKCLFTVYILQHLLEQLGIF